MSHAASLFEAGGEAVWFEQVMHRLFTLGLEGLLIAVQEEAAERRQLLASLLQARDNPAVLCISTGISVPRQEGGQPHMRHLMSEHTIDTSTLGRVMVGACLHAPDPSCR